MQDIALVFNFKGIVHRQKMPPTPLYESRGGCYVHAIRSSSYRRRLYTREQRCDFLNTSIASVLEIRHILKLNVEMRCRRHRGCEILFFFFASQSRYGHRPGHGTARANVFSLTSLGIEICFGLGSAQLFRGDASGEGCYKTMKE